MVSSFLREVETAISTTPEWEAFLAAHLRENLSGVEVGVLVRVRVRGGRALG